MTSETKLVMTSPTAGQYDPWKQRDGRSKFKVSEFMKAMVDAGLKKVGVTVEPDKTARELRGQRYDLSDETVHAGSRIEYLENCLYQREWGAARNYIEENSGANYDEIIQHVLNTVPEPFTTHLKDLEDEDVQVDGDRYYPRFNREEEK